MAYVKTCPACKKQVSSRAERCPHCGDISPQQKAQARSQGGSAQKNMNITINAGEVNNGIVEDREPRFSKVEDPSLKDDFYCSTCSFYQSRLRYFIIRTILTTIICAVIFFIPNYFGWWAFFDLFFKLICIFTWIIMIIRYFLYPEDYCRNEHVIVAVGSNDPASRINSNFKCKFWKNKKDTQPEP